MSKEKKETKVVRAMPLGYEAKPDDGHSHIWLPTFNGGDTYHCILCGDDVDATEDDCAP